MQLKVKVNAAPVAQPRVKATSIGGVVRVYTPMRVKSATTGTSKPHPITAYKLAVRCAVQELYLGPPLEGPLRLDCCFVLPRPKAITRKTRPNLRVPHTSKPDRDNLDKAVMDALTGLLWIDDCQVCQGYIEKWIAAGDEEPHVVLTVTALGEISWS